MRFKLPHAGEIMKHAFYRKMVLTVFVAVVFAGCDEDAPPSVFDPNAPGGTTPTITSVQPESLAVAGLTEVVITGSNFAEADSDNVVYFGATKATLTSATSTEIRVVPPAIVGEDLMIQIVVAGAYETATYGPYDLEALGIEYGGFGNLDEVQSLAIDANENLYANMKSGVMSFVVLVPPSGQNSTYGTTTFPKASQMNIGSGGDLYLQQSSSRYMFTIPPGGGTPDSFATLPNGPRSNYFDFDVTGNIFSAGNKSGLYVIRPDASLQEVGDYDLFDVKSIRVYDGYVYLAAINTGPTPDVPGIWRNMILAPGDLLGPAELVFDWANAGVHATSSFFSITFSSDGDLYVGTDHTDPILIIKPDDSIETLYPGLLVGPAGSLVWGTGTYLYQNRTSDDDNVRRLIRISIGKTGAPYYGR